MIPRTQKGVFKLLVSTDRQNIFRIQNVFYIMAEVNRLHCTSIRETQAVKVQVAWAVLVTPGLVAGQRKKTTQREGGGEQDLLYFLIICINTLTHTHIPVEQLQGHSVSIVVGHQIHSLVAQTQVSHQGLHHTGLLEDWVPVGSLGCSDTKGNELRMCERSNMKEISFKKIFKIWLTGLSLKPKPRKSSAMTRWKRWVSGSQICVGKKTCLQTGSHKSWSPKNTLHFSVVRWSATERMQWVPCSSRSWRWGSRGAEWRHQSFPKHRRNLEKG